jgi:uncharacterized membrane protein YqjE
MSLNRPEGTACHETPDARSGVKPPPVESAAPGFVASLRRLGDGLLATVQDRVALFSIEVQEEKAQLLRLYVWLSVTLLTGLLAFVFASLTLLYLLWDRAPVAALVILTAFYAAACIALTLTLRRRLRSQDRPFAGTLDEMEKDRTCLREKA